MNAEARTMDLLHRAPKVRAELLEKAHNGGLPDLGRFGLKVDDLVALAEGRRSAHAALEVAGQESVSQRALEAIVRQFGRPVLLIQNDTYVAPGADSVAAELAPHRAR